MQPIPFHKMSGAGNDFIIIDNRRGIVDVEDLPSFAAKVCRRRMSVGADGLILLETSDRADFKWQFFNADGSIGEMCGNGARCVARLAYLTGMCSDTLCFETLAGIVSARVQEDQVRVRMTDPGELVLDASLELPDDVVSYSSVNTGVPHAVIEVDDVEGVDVFGLGRTIRRHSQFAPAGTNVDFIAPLEPALHAIRTYERGVEDETLACGTGITAAALTLAAKYDLASPVALRARSGSLLKVYFSRDGRRWTDIHLEGDARVIYSGELREESWRY